MITLHIKGQVTADGQLHFELPDNLPVGAVDITLEIPTLDEQSTTAGTSHVRTFTPSSCAEVVAASVVGGSEHATITDPLAWVEEQRRKQRERREW